MISVQNRKEVSKSQRWASVSPSPSNEDTTMSNKSGVSLRNLTKVYPTGNGQRIAVNNVSVDFMVNEVTALLGHNGAGKSTMM